MRGWRRTRTRTVARTPIFSLLSERRVGPKPGQRQDFYVLTCPDWVNVVAIDRAGRVLLIRQPRYGSERTELEIPGGAVEHGEGAVAAGRRELLEETGYGGGRWRSLGWVQPNPAFHRNRCHVCLARGVRPVAPPRLEPAEQIRVVKAAPSRLPGLVARGRITHALVIAAFYRLGLAR